MRSGHANQQAWEFLLGHVMQWDAAALVSTLKRCLNNMIRFQYGRCKAGVQTCKADHSAGGAASPLCVAARPISHAKQPILHLSWISATDRETLRRQDDSAVWLTHTQPLHKAARCVDCTVYPSTNPGRYGARLRQSSKAVVYADKRRDRRKCAFHLESPRLA